MNVGPKPKKVRIEKPADTVADIDVEKTAAPKRPKYDIGEEPIEDCETAFYEDPLDVGNNFAEAEAVVAQDVPGDGEQSVVHPADLPAPAQPKVTLGTSTQARELKGVPPLALSPLQKHRAPSQQQKLTKSGKGSNAASSIDALLSERKQYWDQKLDLNIKRQEMAEAQSEKDYDIRMKELAVREKEAEAAKEQAEAQNLMMRFIIQKLRKCPDGNQLFGHD